MRAEAKTSSLYSSKGPKVRPASPLLHETQSAGTSVPEIVSRTPPTTAPTLALAPAPPSAPPAVARSLQAENSSSGSSGAQGFDLASFGGGKKKMSQRERRKLREAEQEQQRQQQQQQQHRAVAVASNAKLAWGAGTSNAAAEEDTLAPPWGGRGSSGDSEARGSGKNQSPVRQQHQQKPAAAKSLSFMDVMHADLHESSQRKAQESVIHPRSPTWLAARPMPTAQAAPALDLRAIMRLEGEKKVATARTMSKSLRQIQIEESALTEIRLLYEQDEEYEDEEIISIELVTL